jgi:hypothetical protein
VVDNLYELGGLVGRLIDYGRKLDRTERRAFIRHSLLCHREVLVAPRGQAEIDVEDIRLRQLERRILSEMERNVSTIMRQPV